MFSCFRFVSDRLQTMRWMCAHAFTLARSDQPNDWTVTSSRLISIRRRHSYSEDSVALMPRSFSCGAARNGDTHEKNRCTGQAECAQCGSARLPLTHCSALRGFFSTGFPTEPPGRSGTILSTCDSSQVQCIGSKLIRWPVQ